MFPNALHAERMPAGDDKGGVCMLEEGRDKNTSLLIPSLRYYTLCEPNRAFPRNEHYSMKFVTVHHKLIFVDKLLLKNTFILFIHHNYFHAS